MKYTEKIESFITTFELLRSDAEKADKGNKSAKARLRKAMIEIKKYATEARKEMMEDIKSE